MQLRPGAEEEVDTRLKAVLNHTQVRGQRSVGDGRLCCVQVEGKISCKPETDACQPDRTLCRSFDEIGLPGNGDRFAGPESGQSCAAAHRQPAAEARGLPVK